jgi:ribosomal protein S18 acetylase RimI-like enzyme
VKIKKDSMDTKYRIDLEQEPTPGDMDVIFNGLQEYNSSRANITLHYIVLTVRGAQENVIGGLVGNTFLGWLYVQALWIPENLRKAGIGSSLVKKAEHEAARRGCGNVWLDTFSFQALPFYKKLGYTVFAELPDYPPGETRYFLTRSLRDIAVADED